MSNANTQQVGGGHYKGTTYQHWDFVRIALAGRYLEGNITKYITRWRKKNGLQDLEKARHYLTKLIEEFNLGNVSPMANYYRVDMTPQQTWEHFCDVNGVDVAERMVVQLISTYTSRTELHKAGEILDALIDKQRYAEEDQRVEVLGQPVDDGKVRVPYEATDEMAKSVESIVSAYAAKKVWRQMCDTALFTGEADAGYVNQG